MTWANLRTLGYIAAFLILGAVITAVYGAFRAELERSSYIGFIGGVVLGTVLVSFLVVVMLVPLGSRGPLLPTAPRPGPPHPAGETAPRDGTRRHPGSLPRLPPCPPGSACAAASWP